ncbi:hypothetical protein [Dyella sp. Tek66A03]|uniref:hypothetical protein n=1 Tax=Dyella sp. Tek66A03 TaxID=3458298 RepID=UPI00403ED628
MVLVLHALFVLMLWHEMQSRPKHQTIASVDKDQALVVRLLGHPSKPRPTQPTAPPTTTPPEVVPPRQAVAPRVRPVIQEKPSRDAMVVQDHQAPPAPAASAATPASINLRLAPSTSGVAAATSVAPKPDKPADDRQIMQHDSNRAQYKATRFEKYFPPPNETAGGAVGRHIGDTMKEMAKSICDPAKKSTAFNPLCAAPPPPASSKDRDERLNLPPAQLAADPNPPKGPPLSDCIAEYKDGEPLSYGCPIDTPDLAFKAEMRECIDLFRAGKRLKTWCPADTPKRAAAESSAPAASSSAGPH